MFSIICVYNDENKLNNCLIKSLNNINTDYELILVDNTKSDFACAADALNYGGNKAKNDFLMFAHQDMIFCEDNLDEIENICNSIPNLGVAGFVGVPEISNRKVFSNIYHAIPCRKVSPYNITEFMDAQTLDECIFIVPRNLFIENKFDNKNNLKLLCLIKDMQNKFKNKINQIFQKNL